MTVKELREQLERLEQLGLENYEIFYQTENDLFYKLEVGVHDTNEQMESISIY